jgi:hypothetical protein
MLVAGLGLDALETATQLRITRELPGTSSTLTLLAIGSAGKFAVLSVVSLCAGAALIARRGIASRIAGAGCVIGAALAVVGLADSRAVAVLPLGTALAWTIMWLYAVAAAMG